MVDRGKVIYSIERCICHVPDACRDCAYDAGHPYNECVELLLKDALSLLKAYEPVKPYIDYDGQDVWRCGSCGATLFHLSHTQADENEQNCVKFCRYCGKAVKW